MKLHRPVVEHVIAALRQIFAGSFADSADGETVRSEMSDRVLERIFKGNRKLGGRDRKLIAEATYDVVRWWRRLWASIDRDYLKPDNEGLWQVVGAWLVINEFSLPEWNEFRGLNATSILRTFAAIPPETAIGQSFPDWLFALGTSELGARWPNVAHSLNQAAPVVLRANRLKITRDILRSELKAEGIDCEFAPQTADGLILSERRNVFATASFHSGHFEVQDGASQAAAPLLGAQPGDRVLDGCAGAGGKSLHLAALMKNKGKIIALDVYPRKLEELRKRCTRAGVDIVETRLVESSKTIKRMAGTFDRVLLDVPCSGMGVLRRNPDAKWRLKPDEMERLRMLQTELLTDYSELTKPGGRLVYATCSILPSENSQQVDHFLKVNSDRWSLITQQQQWPGENGYDGFYTAVLEKRLGY